MTAAAVVRCGVCGRCCIPLADYDVPTCVACDASADAVLARASVPFNPAPSRAFAAAHTRKPKPIRGALA